MSSEQKEELAVASSPADPCYVPTCATDYEPWGWTITQMIGALLQLISNCSLGLWYRFQARDMQTEASPMLMRRQEQKKPPKCQLSWKRQGAFPGVEMNTRADPEGSVKLGKVVNTLPGVCKTFAGQQRSAPTGNAVSTPRVKVNPGFNQTR